MSSANSDPQSDSQSDPQSDPNLEQAEKFSPPPVPREIKKLDDERLKIVWQDGHESTYEHRFLRRECPCAGCSEERAKVATQPIDALRVVTANAPTKYVPTNISMVGRYAINIAWNDQHASGIYTFKMLRNLCACSECMPAGPAPIPHNEFGQIVED